MPDSEEFLTVREVAELLKLNQATVRNWISRGELRASRTGRRVRIARSDLQAKIDAGATIPTPTNDQSRSGLAAALRTAAQAADRGDDDQLAAALGRLAEETARLSALLTAAPAGGSTPDDDPPR